MFITNKTMDRILFEGYKHRTPGRDTGGRVARQLKQLFTMTDFTPEQAVHIKWFNNNCQEAFGVKAINHVTKVWDYVKGSNPKLERLIQKRF